MKSIDAIQLEFQQVQTESLAAGKLLAESIDMLSVGEVKETIAKSLVEMESLVSRESSKLERFPILGKYLAKARDTAKVEMAQSGKMVETVERLFKTLKNKNDNVMDVMERIYNIREHVKQYIVILQAQEAVLEEFLESDNDSFEAQKARNLLVQIKPSIIKSHDRLAVMAGTLNSAQVASQAISSMLPSLQGELQTELAINSAMNELHEFKEIFDATVNMVEELNHSNNVQVRATVLEVNQLAVQNPRNLERLKKNQEDRQQMHLELRKQTQEAQAKQIQALGDLSKLQESQALSLGHTK